MTELAEPKTAQLWMRERRKRVEAGLRKQVEERRKKERDDWQLGRKRQLLRLSDCWKERQETTLDQEQQKTTQVEPRKREKMPPMRRQGLALRMTKQVVRHLTKMLRPTPAALPRLQEGGLQQRTKRDEETRRRTRLYERRR